MSTLHFIVLKYHKTPTTGHHSAVTALIARGASTSVI